MDNERSEDLNPPSEDIEEKVWRMMDPRLPDNPIVSADPLDSQTVASAPMLPTKASKVAKETPRGTAANQKLQKIESNEGGEVVGTAPPVTRITIKDYGESPGELAEKLDENIAELDHIQSEPNHDTIKPENLPIEDPAVITDPVTDKAVEDIIAKEGDELLEVEDAVRDSSELVETTKKPRLGFRQILKKWWSRPGFRWGVAGFVLLVLAVVTAMPLSRYFVLNTVGVSASSSLVVLDDSTQQPLKNVQVSIGLASGVTDAEGRVTLSKVRLGKEVLSIDKRAFAPITKTITLGWGSNPLGDFRLTPTGSQYSFVITDFLSGQPIAKVEAGSGEASAVSDDKGVIKLTVDAVDEKGLAVTIKAAGYRVENMTIDPAAVSNYEVRMVPERKQSFISNRSGKYDVYSVYVDGKDEKLVLAATGSEQGDMTLVPHASQNVAALVSTRGNQHNSDGFLLSNLTVISLDDNSAITVGVAERVQVVSFSGDYLIYVRIAAGSSANNPKRYQLMSYNYKEDVDKELASSNFFNDVVGAGNSVYYAPSAAYQPGKVGFYKVNPDDTGLQTVLDQEVWNILRTSYDNFALSVSEQWYDYSLGDSSPSKLNAAPSNQKSRVYVDSPLSKNSVWIDSRDGKGVLIAYDTAKKTDAVLHSQSGISYPVRWLSEKVITYRVKTDQETADYAISLDGGKPVKIRDVTNYGGIDRWYYY